MDISYKESVKKRRLMMWGLAVFLFVCFFFSFYLGRYPVTPIQVMSVICDRIAKAVGLGGLIDLSKFYTPDAELVVIQVRLQRILAAVIIGASLSVAGATYQAIFRNPMVSPDILGATSSAGFGAALAIIYKMSYFYVSVSAFFMSIFSLLLVYAIASKFKGDKILGLILSGIMVGSLFSAGTSFIKLVADTESTLPQIIYWLMGSLSSIYFDDIKLSLIPILVGFIPLVLLRWRINIFTMGDAEARSLGVDASRLRITCIIFATLLTATCVAMAGVIGWIGLVIPHIVRLIVGQDYRYVIPGSAFFGAGFLLIVDNFSRLMYSTEIPIGILTAFVGVPFFMYLILRGGANGATENR